MDETPVHFDDGEPARLGEPARARDSDPPGPGGAPMISLRGVRKSYLIPSGEVVRILNGVDLDIPAGSFTVIRGETGSGKTSLLRILGMLDGDFEGRHTFLDEDLSEKPDWYWDEVRSNNIGFVFQDGQLFEHLTLRANIELPVQLRGTREERARLPEQIEDLGPLFFRPDELRADILARKPTKVSGGQKQRAAIMRAFMARPPLILADEPTASLDEKRKGEVVDLLLALQGAGHTVVVVSHDKIFYGAGRQLLLAGGVLTEVAPPAPPAERTVPIHPTAEGGAILYGWRPRAPAGILLAQAAREAFLRPLFLLLVVTALFAGVCQVGVFASLIVGAETFVNDAMTRGSRLNRLEIKPKSVDLDKPDRFPAVATIRSWDTIAAIVPRRATLARIVQPDGETGLYSAMGLQPGDPEYRLLDFVAGGPFGGNSDALEVIVTAGLVSDLFADAKDLGDGRQRYGDFIGRSVVIEIPQFSRSGQEVPARARRIKLRLVGIILFAEGGRQLYLPSRTQLAFDRYKMDREGKVVLPVSEGGEAWTGGPAAIDALADFAWEDQLQIYTKEIRSILPVIAKLSELGYKPVSDIWNFKWVLDIRDLAWKVFIPMLALIVSGVGLTVAANLLSSAKMREKEFARWRILGMRRGDLVLTQIVATALMVLVGTLLGLVIASLLVESARGFLAAQNPGGGLEKVFAPVGQFYGVVLVAALLLGIASAIYPAFRTARTDPAKILQS